MIQPCGIRANRLDMEINAGERAFTAQWMAEHDIGIGGRDFLGLLLSHNEVEKEPLGEITERDRIIASTLIQWLGTNVGTAFIDEARARIES